MGLNSSVPDITGELAYPGQDQGSVPATSTYDKPASEESDDADLLARIKGWHKESSAKIADWRVGAEEEFEMVAGNQWPDGAKDALEAQGKVAITFNRIGPVIDAVRGLQINNVEDTTFKPRGQEDAQLADSATHLIKSLRDDCDATDEESTAFDDCVICGLGCLETRIDEDGDLKPVIERMSPMEVGWDTSARKRNFIDRRYDWVEREVSIYEARAQFPEIEDDDDLDAAWARSDKPSQSTSQSPKYHFGKEQDAPKKETVTFVDFQWWERKPMMRVTDPQTGVEIDVEVARAETLMERAEQLAAITGAPISMRMRQVRKKVWFHAIVGGKILHRGELPIDDGQGARKFLTGKLNRADNMPYGIVRSAIDPQRAYNKQISQQIHLLNTTAKSGVIHEESAIEDVTKFEENMAKPGARLEVADGALVSRAVQFINPPTVSTALVQMADVSSREINQVTGVNLETLGLLDRDQAGIETHQRKQSTVTNLAWAFDALSIARKDCSKSMILYAISYTPNDVLARMLPAEMAPIIEQMQAQDWVPYDVVIDESPTSPNAKERTWAFMQGILGMMASQGLKPETWVEILRYSPMPNSFVESFARTLLKPPAPEEIAKAEDSAARMARMQDAEAAKDEADALYKQAQAAAKAKEFNLAVTKAVRETIGNMSNNPGVF